MIIGITGGTGCGKTTALDAIRRLGGTVFDCDQIYHDLLKTDKALLKTISLRFPGTVIEGELQRKALGAIRDQVERFLQDGPETGEMSRVREQAKASILMGMESIQSRMNHMARSYQLYGRIQELDELVEQYDAVTEEDVLALARELMTPEQMSFSAVGSVGRMESYRRIFGLSR